MVAWLAGCVVSTAAFGQSVPEEYLDGIIALDAPLPTRFTTGETYWVRGSVADEGIPALTFEFDSSRGILEHRALVVNGRVEHPLVFKHSDAGLHDFRIAFFPSDGPILVTEPFVGIEILEGEGRIERPWQYYDGFIDDAYFRPNVIRTDASEFPPLFVTTAGHGVESVLVLVPDGSGGNLERVAPFVDDLNQGRWPSVLAPLGSGSISFHHSLTLHCSGANQSAARRRGCAVHYMRARSFKDDAVTDAPKMPPFKQVRGRSFPGRV